MIAYLAHTVQILNHLVTTTNTSLQDACTIPGAIHSPNQARPIIPVIWTRLYQAVWHHYDYCSKCVICLLDTETL